MSQTTNEPGAGGTWGFFVEAGLRSEPQHILDGLGRLKHFCDVLVHQDHETFLDGFRRKAIRLGLAVVETVFGRRSSPVAALPLGVGFFLMVGSLRAVVTRARMIRTVLSAFSVSDTKRRRPPQSGR